MKLRKPPPWESNRGARWQPSPPAGERGREAVDHRGSVHRPAGPLSPRQQGAAPSALRLASLPRIDVGPDWSAPPGMSESAVRLYQGAVNEAMASLPACHGAPAAREAPPRYEDLPSPRPESLPPYETPPSSPTGGRGDAANASHASAEHAHAPSAGHAEEKAFLSRSWTRGSMILSRVSHSRLVSRLKDGHKALPTLPPLSKQRQLEWAAFGKAMDAERDSWIAKAALPEAPPSSTALSSTGVRLALDLAHQVVSAVRQDIEEARIHVDKFLAMSHSILAGESREAAEERRAGTPEEAGAMFRDRMAAMAVNRQKALISVLCEGAARDPACQPTLLALGQQWGLDENRLRLKLAEQAQRTGAPAAGDQQVPSGPPA